ncbi:hypothetical protein [Corynebacterium argentoratense]|uniref:hypothetical protein n=1 Tax=Corynebacterium argentoratense TaxID=42817 RepID=UPI00242D1CA3|nr:hypothetical protein [Corynebacterium argentoratense]
MQSIRGTFDKAAAVLIVGLIVFIALRKTGAIQPQRLLSPSASSKFFRSLPIGCSTST